MTPRSEEGSVTVVAAAVLAMLVVLSMGVADVAAALLAREHARTAADAAALAAVAEFALPTGADPVVIAREYAERNGASLTSCACAAGASEVTVTVRVNVPDFLLFPGGPTVTVRSRAVVG